MRMRKIVPTEWMMAVTFYWADFDDEDMDNIIYDYNGKRTGSGTCFIGAWARDISYVFPCKNDAKGALRTVKYFFKKNKFKGTVSIWEDSYSAIDSMVLSVAKAIGGEPDEVSDILFSELLDVENLKSFNKFKKIYLTGNIKKIRNAFEKLEDSLNKE